MYLSSFCPFGVVWWVHLGISIEAFLKILNVIFFSCLLFSLLRQIFSILKLKSPPKMVENITSHLVFGVGNWNNDPANLAKQREMLAICRKHGINTFDVARHYVSLPILSGAKQKLTKMSVPRRVREISWK